MKEKQEIVIDSANTTLGSLAAYAAKQALLGKRVILVNCNEAIITGNKKSILKTYLQKRQRGGSNFKGPHFPKEPYRILKKTIKGMLPYRKERGSLALKSIICYNEIPNNFYEKKQPIKQKVIKTTFITLKELGGLI